MASIRMFQGHGFNLCLTNEGTSPIADSVNISTADGDDITLTIKQLYQLNTLINQAIRAHERTIKDNQNRGQNG